MVREPSPHATQQERPLPLRPLLAVALVPVLLWLPHPLPHWVPPRVPRQLTQDPAALPPPPTLVRPYVRRLVRPELWVLEWAPLPRRPVLLVLLTPRLHVEHDRKLERLLAAGPAVRLPHLLLAVGLPNLIGVRKWLRAQLARLLFGVLLAGPPRLCVTRLALARLVPRVTLVMLFTLLSSKAFLQLVREIQESISTLDFCPLPKRSKKDGDTFGYSWGLCVTFVTV